MNADAIKSIILTMREDWKVMGNPFKYLVDGCESPFIRNMFPTNAARCRAFLNATEINYGYVGTIALKDLAVAYDAWLDLYPDSWDAGPAGLSPKRYPSVIDEFIPFAQDVQTLLDIRPGSHDVPDALWVANMVRGTVPGPWDAGCGWVNFHHLVMDLKAEHEQALEDLENLEAKERLDEIRGGSQ